MKFLKPKIVISKCLEFDACRFDGQMINSKYIKKLKKFIDFQTTCPEVEIGMGTPRKPIRIVENDGKKLLIQKDTGIDFSDKMNDFSREFLNNIDSIDGFILKATSPSCGIKNTKKYTKSSPAPTGKTSGLFASNVSEIFPLIPKEDEKRLSNPFIREYFYTTIFTIADYRTVENLFTLHKYHAKHKYLFMSFNQVLLKKLGNIAANMDKKSFNIVMEEYFNCLLLLLSKKPRYPSNINSQMHVMGYFKKDITSSEKKHFLNMIELYRQRKVPISSVNSILSSWIHRFNNEYLMNQSFLQPFPIELIDSENSRFL
tara:strand:- start:960 stop:1904 length:945 start_codon:yes stop_codon:yes gene_type:complete